MAEPSLSSRPSSPSRPNSAGRRAAWLKTLHRWHWVSSALSLAGMLLFALTGITLNHAADIEAKPQVVALKARLPETLLAELRAAGGDGVPAPLAGWAGDAWGVELADAAAEWSGDELYVPLPRPGGDAWLRVGLADGEVEYERTDRGWISWLNDLHKGRHTGAAWRLFIDAFAAACAVFTLTGLLILRFHAAGRPGTWPVVGAGLLVPLLLALLLMH